MGDPISPFPAEPYKQRTGIISPPTACGHPQDNTGRSYPIPQDTKSSPGKGQPEVRGCSGMGQEKAPWFSIPWSRLLCFSMAIACFWHPTGDHWSWCVLGPTCSMGWDCRDAQHGVCPGSSPHYNMRSLRVQHTAAPHTNRDVEHSLIAPSPLNLPGSSGREE